MIGIICECHIFLSLSSTLETLEPDLLISVCHHRAPWQAWRSIQTAASCKLIRTKTSRGLEKLAWIFLWLGQRKPFFLYFPWTDTDRCSNFPENVKSTDPSSLYHTHKLQNFKSSSRSFSDMLCPLKYSKHTSWNSKTLCRGNAWNQKCLWTPHMWNSLRAIIYGRWQLLTSKFTLKLRNYFPFFKTMLNYILKSEQKPHMRILCAKVKTYMII